MPNAARVGDSISGMTTGNHHCWQEPIYDEDGEIIDYRTVCSPPSPIAGNITSGSSNVYINGQKAAFVGSTTSETDAYDTGTGVVSSGSSKVYINGNRAARKDDTVTPHNGTASISSGSSNVFFG